MRWRDHEAAATRARMAAYRYDPVFLAATDEALHELQGCHEILEIGPGAGVEATRLALAGAEVTGLDITEDLAREGPWSLVLGDAHDMPFEDESFDGLLFNRIIHHLTDLPAMLTEARRVLRERGIAVFVWPDWHETRCSPEHQPALVAAQTLPGLGCAAPVCADQVLVLAAAAGLTAIKVSHLRGRYEGSAALTYAFGHLIATEEKRQFLSARLPEVFTDLCTFSDELEHEEGFIEIALAVLVVERSEMAPRLGVASDG